MTERPTVVWFRRELRLHDNPALYAAVHRGRPMVLVYVLDATKTKDALACGSEAPGGASRWWLHHSLAAL